MILARAPFRISFIGGGTDLPFFCNEHEGAVVSAAINLYSYVLIRKSWSGKYLVRYSQTEESDTIDGIKNDRIRESMKLLGWDCPIELASFGDVPISSGLGGSSAYTVAAINALRFAQSKSVSRETLADMACEVEINRIKDPIGRQDQYACALGGINLLRFSGSSVSVEPIRMQYYKASMMSRCLLLGWIGGRQRGAADVIRDQQNDLTPKRLEYMKSMASAAVSLAEDLRQGKIAKLADYLDLGWTLKQKLSDQIAPPEVTEICDKVMKAGARGIKLCGAGGHGGFILVYVHPLIGPKVIKSVSGVRWIPIKFDQRGAVTNMLARGGFEYVPGANLWTRPRINKVVTIKKKDTTCLQCGRRFIRNQRPNEIASFCSEQCRNEGVRKRREEIHESFSDWV